MNSALFVKTKKGCFMKNTAKSWYVVVATVMSILVGGCCTFNMGETEVELAEQYQISVNSVEEVVPKITFVKSSENGRRYYNLELIAKGEFIKHNGVKVATKEKRMCIGLMPGVAWFKAGRRKEGKNESLWWIDGFGTSLIGNCMFCLIPTVATLLVEPFLPYYGDEDHDQGSDMGFLGCRKYFAKGEKGQRFVEKSTESISAQRLYGFKVSIDGAECRDGLLPTGYTAKAEFRTTRPVGSKLVIKLLSAPAMRVDSDDKLTDLVGVEMEAVLP